MEIWKDIEGYEGQYQVSNLGNVKSLIHNKILKPVIRQGYYSVKLYKNNQQKNKPIHRLVANAFVLKEDANYIVNHLDGNKLNNNTKNLEWCTHSQNTKHAYKIGLEKPTERLKESARINQKRAVEKTSIKINQYDLDNNFIKQWNSISEANRSFNKTRTKINEVCKNKCKQAMGFIWKYATN